MIKIQLKLKELLCHHHNHPILSVIPHRGHRARKADSFHFIRFYVLLGHVE